MISLTRAISYGSNIVVGVCIVGRSIPYFYINYTVIYKYISLSGPCAYINATISTRFSYSSSSNSTDSSTAKPLYRIVFLLYIAIRL